jgi:hypothetical protein
MIAQAQSRFHLALIAAACLLGGSCTLPVGLEPVSGVAGDITFHGNWPDSLTAAALIVLDELDLKAPAEHLITYSDPVLAGATASAYFVQLPPGQYFLVAAGLTVEPALFAARIDSFLTAPQVPIVIIDDDLITLATPVVVRDREVAILNRVVRF